jgi:uridine kinase
MEGPLLLGIAGGSASGKSLVTSTLIENLGSREVVMIEQDSYYKDFAGLTMEERAKLNFDHPDAFDRELLLDHMEALLRGQPIEKPTYDFTHHSRLPETVRVEGHRVIVLEGILVLEDPALRRLMDIKVFIDTDADVRLIRRIRRVPWSASAAWSRSSSSTKSVRPMHLQFISPPSATPTS